MPAQGAPADRPAGTSPLAALLEGLPVAEDRLDLAGVSTWLVRGGDGPPVVLLHGQGGFAAMWAGVIRHLAGSHRVVAPDLPGLGRSEVPGGALDAARVTAWLGELVAKTCDGPPVLVGHSLGGGIAARFAVEHSDRLRRLVLVDSSSLGRFRPALGAVKALVRFSRRPDAASLDGFMSQVFVDPARCRSGLGDRWPAFRDSLIEGASRPSVSAANRRLLRTIGARRIPPRELQRISVPVALIWGRDDRVNRFRIAERVAAELGWPLLPIEDCGHIPQGERPDAFLRALGQALAEEG